MGKWTNFFTNNDLRKRLTIWFLLISLIPLTWTIWISYEVSKNNIYTLVQNQLRIFIYRQGQLLDYYFREKEENAIAIVNQAKGRNQLEVLKTALTKDSEGNISYENAEKMLSPFFDGLLKAFRFRNLYILTPDTKITFSVHPSPLIKSSLSEIEDLSTLTQYFEESVQSKKPQLASLVLPKSQSELLTYIFIPVFDESNLVAVILIELNNSSFFRLLTEYNILTESGGLGELMVVGQVGSQLFSISSSNATEPEPSYKIHTIDNQSDYGVFLEHLLEHQHILSSVVTIKGEKFLLVGKHFLPSFNWAMIVKISLSQIYAPIHKIQTIYWILALTTAIAVISAAGYVARKLAAPILALTRKTQLLARGDLSQRIHVTSQDEIGRLGESFNDMAIQLDQMVSHLDSLVEKRTKEYEIQNVQLEQTIDELKKTQDQLIIQEKLASLGALTAGIAHEIKNPLNFINNFAELSSQIEQDLEERLNKLRNLIPASEAEEIDALFETLKLDLNKINDHGKRADSIVRNMLQHSRAIPGQREFIDIHLLLDEYISLTYHGMRAQDRLFNVKIEKNFDPSLPPVEVVPQEISRVFLNVLYNSYYAVTQKAKLHPQDYTPVVRVATENHQDFIAIKFWDNGIGIPPEVYSKLFTPFFTTKPPGEGTGLGLSLSYNIIVQGHQGTLTAQSTPGEYAEFIITLPVGQKKTGFPI